MILFEIFFIVFAESRGGGICSVLNCMEILMNAETVVVSKLDNTAGNV